MTGISSPAYAEYRSLLVALTDISSRSSADIASSRSNNEHANALAEQAEQSASTRSADAIKAIELQLESARTVLEPVGKSVLIPPRIRPSGGPRQATRDDIAKAQLELVAAVNELRDVVKAQQREDEAERQRLAQAEAERIRVERDAGARAAAAAKRRRLIGIASAILSVVVVLVVIVILVR